MMPIRPAAYRGWDGRRLGSGVGKKKAENRLKGREFAPAARLGTRPMALRPGVNRCGGRSLPGAREFAGALLDRMGRIAANSAAIRAGKKRSRPGGPERGRARPASAPRTARTARSSAIVGE